MKINIGDRVKLKNIRGRWWNGFGKMDKYIGKIVTVSGIYQGKLKNGFTIKEDDGRGFPRCVFYLEDVECVVNQRHFKSLPNDYTGILNIENGFIKEILDEAEKRYLKVVIRPFKNRVRYILKKDCCNCNGDCYISIVLDGDSVGLPCFKKDSMYNDMEVGKRYTLKELGLDV